MTIPIATTMNPIYGAINSAYFAMSRVAVAQPRGPV